MGVVLLYSLGWSKIAVVFLPQTPQSWDYMRELLHLGSHF